MEEHMLYNIYELIVIGGSRASSCKQYTVVLNAMYTTRWVLVPGDLLQKIQISKFSRLNISHTNALNYPQEVIKLDISASRAEAGRVASKTCNLPESTYRES